MGFQVRFLVALLSFAIPEICSAATYYVDFVSGSDANSGVTKSAPWKRAPGMSGFSGVYSPQAGDIFLFKGGVTWTNSFPWTLAGGSPSARTTYSVDKSWFTGATFSQPAFDRQGGGQLLIGASYVTLNELAFLRCGTSQVGNNIKCLQFDDSREVTITNSRFATESWISMFFVFTTPGTYENFEWRGNDFAHTSGAIWFASAAANTTMRNLTYTGNTFHDFASQIGDSVHGDGAWHGYVIPPADSSQVIQNLTFCNNRFYGDFRRSFGTDGGMTAFFFQEGGLKNALLCNNEMGFSPVQANIFDSLIVLEGENNAASDGVRIYNNSLANIGTNAMSAGIRINGNFKNIDLKNNIISGMNYPIYVEDPSGSGSSFSSNYNLLAGSNLIWGGAFQSLATWQSQGRDANSLLGVDPRWVNPPTDFQLQSTSPAMNAGANLTNLGFSILATDISGTARPSTTSWEIGAREFQTTDRIPPSPPTGLSIRP